MPNWYKGSRLYGGATGPEAPNIARAGDDAYH